MMKKLISLVLIMALSLTACASCGVRREKYADAQRIGTTALPKNLNPYSSTASSSTFFVGLFYNTLLGSDLVPVGYEENGGYTFPDGTAYEPIATAKNPLAFKDGLLEYEGALPKEKGSVYGYEYFDPTEEQWKKQCERESIVFGFDESGKPLKETEAEFLKRAEITVPRSSTPSAARYRSTSPISPSRSRCSVKIPSPSIPRRNGQAGWKRRARRSGTATPHAI